MMPWPGAMPWCNSRGVDIIQHCEVTGFIMEGGVCKGVETTCGPIRVGKVMLPPPVQQRVMQAAGMRLPISHVLQAFVSEGLKPIIPA